MGRRFACASLPFCPAAARRGLSRATKSASSGTSTRAPASSVMAETRTAFMRSLRFRAIVKPVVVVLSNGPAVEDIATHVLVAAYPIATCPSSVPASKTDPASVRRRLLQRKRWDDVHCGCRWRRPTQLSIALLPQPAVEVPRIAPDSFYAAMYGAEFKSFIREQESIVGLWLMQGGQTIPAIRLDSQRKAGGRPARIAVSQRGNARSRRY